MDVRTYLTDVLGRAVSAKTKIEKWIDSNAEETVEGLEVEIDGKPHVLSLHVVPPKLSSFGLEVDDEVRFCESFSKDAKRKTWKKARVKGTNVDGSIELSQTATTVYRSIMPDQIERKEKGKRGAEKWVSLTA